MFMRYIGGGIGHLEQFPPPDDDGEDINNDIPELERNFVLGSRNGGGYSGNEGNGSGGNSDEDDDEDEDNDNDDDDNGDSDCGESGKRRDEEEDDDQAELFDEEIGNVY
jgi:hypothetical protein